MITETVCYRRPVVMADASCSNMSWGTRGKLLLFWIAIVGEKLFLFVYLQSNIKKNLEDMENAKTQ